MCWKNIDDWEKVYSDYAESISTPLVLGRGKQGVIITDNERGVETCRTYHEDKNPLLDGDCGLECKKDVNNCPNLVQRYLDNKLVVKVHYLP